MSEPPDRDGQRRETARWCLIWDHLHAAGLMPESPRGEPVRLGTDQWMEITAGRVTFRLWTPAFSAWKPS
jgi:hypothetical protein